MSAERPISWLGCSAVVVGLFVAFAARESGRPNTITLTTETRQVQFAKTHSEAIAKAAESAKEPRRAIVAAQTKKPVAKPKLLRGLPVDGSSISTGSLTSAVATVSTNAARSLVRDLAAHARAYDSQCLVPLQRVTLNVASFVPPVEDVLLTARPSRGPPSV